MRWVSVHHASVDGLALGVDPTVGVERAADEAERPGVGSGLLARLGGNQRVDLGRAVAAAAPWTLERSPACSAELDDLALPHPFTIAIGERWLATGVLPAALRIAGVEVPLVD